MSGFRMPDFNQVVLAGRLTRDPEYRVTNTGLGLVTFSIAWSRKYNEHETKCFLDCKMFHKTKAEKIADDIKKGCPVIVRGELETETWEDKNTKQPRSRIVCNLSFGRVEPMQWPADSMPAASAAKGSDKNSYPDGLDDGAPLPVDDIPF